jgi:hypothetical protein
MLFCTIYLQTITTKNMRASKNHRLSVPRINLYIWQFMTKEIMTNNLNLYGFWIFFIYTVEIKDRSHAI